MPAEAVGKNLGKGRLNRWLFKIIGPATVGRGPGDDRPAGGSPPAVPEPDPERAS